MMRSRNNAAHETEDQEGDEGDGQHEEQVGEALLQPTHPNPPRPENLAEKENPKCGRNQKQYYANNCVGEAQNLVIIHDGLIDRALKSVLLYEPVGTRNSKGGQPVGR